MKPLLIQDDMNVTANGDLSRRRFLKFTGTGLVVFFCAGPLDAWQAASQGVPPTYTEPPKPSVPTDFNAFLQIGADGRVTCLVGRVELGQGPQTAFAQLVADELAVGFDSVNVIMGDTDVCPWTSARLDHNPCEYWARSCAKPQPKRESSSCKWQRSSSRFPSSGCR